MAFQLGRWARWCQRCDSKMWFVRRSLLGAGSAPLISLAQLGRMFWAAVVASTLAPRVPPRSHMSRDGLAASKCRPSQPHCPSRPHHPSWLPCPMAAPWPPSCLRAAEPSAATRGCRGAGISMCFCRTGAAWQVALPLEPRGRLARAPRPAALLGLLRAKGPPPGGGGGGGGAARCR